MIRKFEDNVRKSGVFDYRRNQQNLGWMHDLVSERLLNNFYTDPEIKAMMPQLEKEVVEGKIPPTQAAWRLLKEIDK